MDGFTASRFQLFGFGARRKFVYQNGVLRVALFGDVVASWTAHRTTFEPADYRVTLETDAGHVQIAEDEKALWIDEQGERRTIACSDVRLPAFEGHPRAGLLRALHAELLVSILPWGPVPNLWVYPRPWYRDAAMVAMALARTGNVALLSEWIAGLHQTYDCNNAGHAETDTLGQVLYLASLHGGRSHRIVDGALRAAKERRSSNHLSGLSDFAEHPVYQTKWLKFGLRSLGLDDSDWHIPSVVDSYSSIFWMDYREEHVPAKPFSATELVNYPYLNWAEAHFHAWGPAEDVSVETFPLSREVNASQANYARLPVGLSSARYATPHTWHAAEMFLYFLDARVSPQTVASAIEEVVSINKI